MRSLIKLGFIGSYKTDMLMFIAKSLANLDLKVIVVDSDPNKYLATYLSEFVGDKVIHGKDMDYYIGALPTYFEGLYDVAICDFGTSESSLNDFINCQWHFLITDPNKYHVDPLRSFISKIACKTQKIQLIKIYRDMVGGKINLQYLDFTLMIQETFEVIASYVFSLNIEDYKHRVHSAYNQQVSFNNQSKDYLMFYHDLIEELLSTSKKEIKQAIKKTRKDVVIV